MAETTGPKTRRHLTSITITDGAALSYAIPLRGELTYTPGGFTLVDIKDSLGEFTGLSPTRGEEQATTFSIEATQRGLAGRAAANVALKDFFGNSGAAASGTATSVGDETGSVAGEFQVMYTVTCVCTDHTGTETITFPDCTFLGSSWASSLEGNKITLSGTSRQAYPTVAFA